MKKEYEIKVGESYLLKQEGIDGHGMDGFRKHSMDYDEVLVTCIYEGINGKTVQFKEKSSWFLPTRYLCSYQLFLDGIICKT